MKISKRMSEFIFHSSFIIVYVDIPIHYRMKLCVQILWHQELFCVIKMLFPVLINFGCQSPNIHFNQMINAHLALI